MFDPVNKILYDKTSKNRDEPVNELKVEEQYDLFDPEHLTPQVCTWCGNRIKLKDIHYNHKDGTYMHKKCFDEYFKQKRERRRK